MGLELLIAAIVVLVTQFFRWLCKKVKIDLAKAIVILLSFVVALSATLIYLGLSDGDISLADWPTLVKIWAYATLFFSVIVKRIPFVNLK